MADLSDVEDAFVMFITDIMYPNGITYGSIIGSVCRVYRGWPNTATLNADLSADIINISVLGDSDSGRTTTRYLPKHHLTIRQPGTQVNVSGTTVAVAGIPAACDVVGLIVDGFTCSYQVQVGDTAALVAANLAHAIPASMFATVSGSVIRFPLAHRITARSVAAGTANWEARRQEKNIRIVHWCPSPASRDVVCSAVDTAFSTKTFLTLADASAARVQYAGTSTHDQAQNALLYRRDLVFTVEYATQTTVAQPAMLFGRSELNGNTTTG